MSSDLLAWADDEKRCTNQLRHHLRDVDEGIEKRRWQSPFPIHVLLRFDDPAELPAGVKAPSAARDFRTHMANSEQAEVLSFLRQKTIPNHPLWLINAIRIRLPVKGADRFLSDLGSSWSKVRWFDHVPSSHATPVQPETLKEIDDDVLKRIENEMAAWRVDRVVPPTAIFPGLDDARRLRDLDGAGVRIALLDTGADTSHADLRTCVDYPDPEFDAVNPSERILAEIRPSECYRQRLRFTDPQIKYAEVALVFGLQRENGGPFLQQPLEPKITARITAGGQLVNVMNPVSTPITLPNLKIAHRIDLRGAIPKVSTSEMYEVEVRCSEASAVFAWRRPLVQLEVLGWTSNPPAGTPQSLSAFVGGEDEWGHGTKMAGIIAGRGSSSDGEFQGIAPGASVLSLKVVQNPAMGLPTDRVKEALNWIGTRDEIRLVNISLGGATDCDQRPIDPSTGAPLPCPVCLEVDRLVRELKKIVVVSAGNRGGAGTTCPAKSSEAIVVGSANWAEPQWASSFSGIDANRPADFIVPGENIAAPLARFAGSRISGWRSAPLTVDFPRGLATNNSYTTATGTSPATAAVTGLIARLLQRRPEILPDVVKRLLRASATSLQAPSAVQAPAQGQGVLDVKKLDDLLPDVELSLVTATPQSAGNGATVDLEAKVENRTRNGLQKVRITWILRDPIGTPLASASCLEFPLPALGNPNASAMKTATAVLPPSKNWSDVQDYVCSVSAEDEWQDDPMTPAIRVVDASERDCVIKRV